MSPAHTGGGVGTNQYKVKGRSRAVVLLPPAPSTPTVTPDIFQSPWEQPHILKYLSDHQIHSGGDFIAYMRDVDPNLTIAAIIQDPNRPDGALETIVAFGWRADAGEIILNHPDCPRETMQRLATDPEIVGNTARKALQNHDTPMAIWELYARSVHITARHAVATVPTCPSSVVARLTRDPNAGIRRCALKNPRCPPDILQAHGDDPATRMFVAQNPSTPPEVLRSIFADEDSHYILANNPSTPADLLAQLTRNSDHFKALAQNHNSPSDVLCTLIRHPKFDPVLSNDIVQRAGCDRACLDALAQHNSPRARRAVATHPLCSSALMERYAQSNDTDLLLALAGNKNLTASAAARLVAKGIPEVRDIVLAHHNTPAHIKAIAALG